MTGYQIDDAVLRQVATALDTAHAGTTQGGDALGAVRPAGLGTAGLDAVVGALVTGWSDTLGEVGTVLSDAADGVRSCLAGYTDAERRIAELFGDPS
jgi:hypothetical protein